MDGGKSNIWSRILNEKEYNIYQKKNKEKQ